MNTPGPAADSTGKVQSNEKGGKILVVDDSVHIRVLLEHRLAAEGYDVCLAENGAEALERARADVPDVVISDWMMPVMDGEQLCAHVRADPELRGVFFIMLTAKDSQDARVHSLSSGADDFLVKPWDERELLARIRSGMRILMLQREIQSKDKRDILAKLAVTTAHEINNPLTGLLAELQLIQMDEKLSPRGAEGIDRAVELAQRIADIVSRFRNLDVESTTDYAGGVQMFDINRH